MPPFHTTEKHLSQIPALQLLANLGYQVLTPQQALRERGDKTSNVLLEGVLHEQLKKFNRIHYKGKDYHFSEANIQQAIQKLKNVNDDGLLKTNAKIYDWITLGIALKQTIEGNSKSFNFNYIDWQCLENNVFHVVAEYTVERSRSVETARPDIVLFVNGIPLVVIECKSPTVDIEEAVSQTIRNQGVEYIPKLFTYAQLVMGVSSNAAKYATVGTSEKFWSIWNEPQLVDGGELIVDGEEYQKLRAIKNKTLTDETIKGIEQTFGCSLPISRSQLPTPQDAALYSLCRPERLLDLTYRFTLFEHGDKKIARYQQYFVVKSALQRIKRRNEHGNRTGGMIWHTQGSGKSLTMVMLARALVLDTEITNPRLILVTDRTDLDNQLGNTFAVCGLSKQRATSGRNLVQHLKNKVGIITTLIHKFDRGLAAERFVDESTDIFVLVDESHRTQFGPLASRMRQMLPNCCYLGFTGTPLLQEEKNNFAKFGNLIKPHYSIGQAVKDKAVLPLLYEGRHVEMKQNQAAIDRWFERHTAGLTAKQQADLKRKYARAEMLNKSEQVIYMRAFDISEHYRANWQGPDFKAQLVAPSKAAAVRYHEHLKDLGSVSSEVIISAPDTREGHEEVDEGPTDEVGQFWDKMMQRFGSEEEYTEQIISQFKDGDEPEILIVVDKLLTGFDAPRNTVLYLCRQLREHKLLQAIARVNRLFEGKDFGYIIDYAGTFGELDEALNMYEALAGFDEADLVGTLIGVNEEVQKLPQRHSDLWDVFRGVENKQDEEEFERHLAGDELREEFYERLSEYAKTLAIALSSEHFMMRIDEAKLAMYKKDLKRFMALRQSVQLRYAEKIDFKAYEKKIAKLLDTHIQANEVYQLNKPVDIFDEQQVNAIMEDSDVYTVRTDAAKADTIAHATKKVIREKMDEDPAFYEKFSALVQQAIDDFNEHRISGLDYLHRVVDIKEKVVSKHHDNVPDSISDNDEACAYYGMAIDYFSQQELQVEEDVVADMSTRFQEFFNEENVVDFWHNQEAINKVKSRMDDFFHDVLRDEHGIELESQQMDEIIEKTMQIAKSRRSK